MAKHSRQVIFTSPPCQFTTASLESDLAIVFLVSRRSTFFKYLGSCLESVWMEDIGVWVLCRRLTNLFESWFLTAGIKIALEPSVNVEFMVVPIPSIAIGIPAASSL